MTRWWQLTLGISLAIYGMTMFLSTCTCTYRCVGARERGDVMKAFNLQCIVLQYPPSDNNQSETSLFFTTCTSQS